MSVSESSRVPAVAPVPARQRRARAGRRSPLPALILVVAVHLVVAWFSRPFPHWADPTRVFEYARTYPDVPLDHHALRLGTLVPARAAIELFGFGTVAYYVFPLIMGTLLVVSTFMLGDLLFGRVVAVAAAMVIVLNPYIVESYKYVTGWQLMPDIPAAALFTTGVVLLLHGARAPAAGRSAMLEALSLVLAGGFFGWSYLAREYTVFLFPLILLIAVAWRIRWYKLAYVAVSMLAALAVELVTSSLVYGNPLARLDVASEHTGTPEDPVTRWQALLVGARALDHPTVGPLLVLLLAATLAGVALRRRQHVLLAVWVLLLYVPIMLLSGFVDPNTVSLRGWLPRYWTVAYPAVAIGGTAAILMVWNKLRARTGPASRRPSMAAASVLVVGALTWYSLPTIATVSGDKGGTDDWWEVTEWLEENQADIDAVWTDTRTNQTLRVYQHGRLGEEPMWDLPVGRYPPRGEPYPDPPEGQVIAMVAAPEWGPHILPDEDSGWQSVLTAGDLIVFVSTP